jgi:archaellum biogenesis ATPase FlaH
VVSSGNVELDALLGGGIETGSSTLVLGPAGSGKSLLAFQFAAAAIGRGEKVALFAFDEELGLLFRRTKAMGIDLERFRDEGSLLVEQVDAAELSPGEFSHRARKCVEINSVRTVIIDSLNGYQSAMPEEQSLILYMHELLQFLNRKGAATFLTVAQHGLVCDMKTPVDVTFLADTVILCASLRLEAEFDGQSQLSKSGPAFTKTQSASLQLVTAVWRWALLSSAFMEYCEAYRSIPAKLCHQPTNKTHKCPSAARTRSAP